MRPGDVAPFEIIVMSPPEFDDYSLVVSGSATYQQSSRNYTLLSTREYIDVLDNLVLVGEFRSDEAINTRFVEAIVTFYDSDGNVYDVDSSYAAVDILRPGQKSPFRVSVEYSPEIADKRIQFEGRETYEESSRNYTLLSTREYIDVLDNLVLVGEFRSDEATNTRFVEAIVTFYDGDGNIYNFDRGYAAVDIVRPGQQSPFRVSVDYSPEIADKRIQFQGQETHTEPRTDLVVVSSSTFIQYEALHVVGEIRNDGSTLATSVEAIVTLYDSEGRIWNWGWDYVDDIEPAEVMPFEEVFFSHWFGYETYEVFVQAE